MMKSRAEDGYVAERYMDHGIPYIRVKYKKNDNPWKIFIRHHPLHCHP